MACNDPLLYSGILDGPGSPVILDKDLNFYLDQNILEMDLTFCWGCVTGMEPVPVFPEFRALF